MDSTKNSLEVINYRRYFIFYLELIFSGKLSVSVMGLGNRDGGESTNCSNCGDTCTCGATERKLYWFIRSACFCNLCILADDQRTLVDVDADDVASTVSSVVTSNTAAAPPQSSSLPQRKRSETLNPAIMTVEQSGMFFILNLSLV